MSGHARLAMQLMAAEWHGAVVAGRVMIGSRDGRLVAGMGWLKGCGCRRVSKSSRNDTHRNDIRQPAIGSLSACGYFVDGQRCVQVVAGVAVHPVEGLPANI